MNGNAHLYRVWKDVRRPDGGESARDRRLLFSVGSPTEACKVIRLLQEREKEYPPCRNCGYGLEILSASGWTEWHATDGQDVTGLLCAGLEVAAGLPLNW